MFLNEADYIAWRDPRVRSVAQFLLYDSAPDSRYPPADFSYWDTFQTGLLFSSGRAETGVCRVPDADLDSRMRPSGGAAGCSSGASCGRRRGQHVQQAQIQWRGHMDSFRTIATVTTAQPAQLPDAPGSARPAAAGSGSSGDRPRA